MPYFSIIISVLNGDKTLERAIRSIERQNRDDIELIIKDGGSTDKTISIIEKHNKSITYFESSPDTGVYDAWNKALQNANGEWICFIGCDDFFWSDDVLERYYGYLKTALQKKCPVVYGRNAVINKYGKMLYYMGEPWDKVRFKFNEIMCLPHQGMMHHCQLFNSSQPFNSKFKIAGDYEFLLRHLDTQSPLFANLIVCGVSSEGISTKPINAITCLKEMRLAQKMNGIYSNRMLWKKEWIKAYIRLLLYRGIGDHQFRKVMDTYRKMRGLPSYWTVSK